jgi:hypothetical protein
MRKLGSLLCLSLAIASVDRLQPSSPATRVGTPDLSIGGEDETRDAYIFQTIAGLAFDPSGRIVTVDIMDNTARLYKSDGSLAYAIGRKGSGPGEYKTPLDAAFSADGRLWIKDDDNKRFNSYTLGPDRATPGPAVRADYVNAMYRVQPVAFDKASHIIAIGSLRNDITGEYRMARFVFDLAGTIVHVDTIAEPPADSLGDYKVRKDIPGGSSTYYYYQPYGSAFLVGQSLTGSFVRAVSSRYDVAWRGPDGKLLRTIRRDIEGPTLSAAEKKKGQASIDAFVKNTGISASQLPHGLPDRKARLRHIAFDQLGRLWIEQSTADGAPREADLYDAAGKWTAIMRWPRDIEILEVGMVAAMGNRVLGVGTDSLGVERVVRLVFK